MRAIKHERRDWAIIALILLFGLLFMLLAGGWALRFAPRWELGANMESLLDPNSDFLTRRPGGFIEPVDPAILTNPAGMYAVLTPGASFSTLTQLPTKTGSSILTSTTGTLVATQTATLTTLASVTNTARVFPSPTKTSVFIPPSPSSTSRPNPVFTYTATSSGASTSAPTSTSTSIVVLSPTPSSTSTSIVILSPTPSLISTVTATTTQTPTATSTATATATPSATLPSAPTSTSTNTPDPGEPDFGGPDGNTVILGNGTWVEFNLGGFLLDGNSSFDVVYYEKEETSSAGKIHLGAVLIEVYDQTTAAWYTIYYWGDGVADTNASYSNGVEPDGYPVDKSLLAGAPPLNTGIAIDIDSVAIGQGGASGDSITKIRITSLSNVKCDIDSLQMLR